VIAPRFPIAVLRFPIRSLDQYTRRVEVARSTGELRGSAAGRKVRKAYEGGTLEAIYESLTLDERAVAEGIEGGWLVEDTEIRDYLLATPDALSGNSPPPPGARAWPEERRAEALAQLERDAMYTLSRDLQRYAYRVQVGLRAERTRRRRAERRLWREIPNLRRQTRRLKRIESSLWWRLRPRLPGRRRRRRGPR
jgi:hypothetical protein